LFEQQVPEDERDKWFLAPKHNEKGRVSYDYMGSAWNQVEWHHGITFYDLRGYLAGYRVAKAGCDYQHYWDEDHDYNLGYVEHECRATADSLINAIPNILIRCNYTGKYYEANCMKPWGDGFISPEGEKENKRWLEAAEKAKEEDTE
jgi:hypothetical protein